MENKKLVDPSMGLILVIILALVVIIFQGTAGNAGSTDDLVNSGFLIKHKNTQMRRLSAELAAAQARIAELEASAKAAGPAATTPAAL